MTPKIGFEMTYCHSEGAERPKNLINTRKYKILRFAQDDNMAIGRSLNSVLFFKLNNETLFGNIPGPQRRLTRDPPGRSVRPRRRRSLPPGGLRRTSSPGRPGWASPPPGACQELRPPLAGDPAAGEDKPAEQPPPAVSEQFLMGLWPTRKT